MAKYTITHDEKVKGFTSFHSFIPDWMGGLNNDFYSIKDGQLYRHHDEDNAIRCNFYGVQYTMTLKYIINDAPSEIKVAKAINLEANKAMDLNIKSYLNDETVSITESTIGVTEFLNKEGKWYGYVRRNETVGDLSAKNAYGLGKVSGVATSVITMTTTVPTGSISAGDTLKDAAGTTIGIIQSYTGSTITVDTTPVIAPSTFLLGLKSERIEGSEIRGYNFEVDLTDNTTSRTEIFAASCEMFKSEPS